MAEYVGAIPVYLTDAATFHPNWLSLDPPHDEGGTTVYGEPVTPVVDTVYMVLTDGEYCRRLVTYNGTVYRLVGKMNIKDEHMIVPLGTAPFSFRDTTYEGYNSSSTMYRTVYTVGRGDYKLDVSASCKTKTSGCSIRLRFGGVDIWSPSGSGQSFSRTIEIDQQADVGKTLQVVMWWSSMTSLPDRGAIGVDGTAYKGFLDFETEEYLPNTDMVNGQSGLVFGAEAGTSNKAFTSSGWDDVPLDITAEEIKTIFDNATGTTTTYNGTEFIIGEFGGKTLYESRLPLSGISGNDLNSFEFAAHKMIDGRLSLPARLIDMSISKSGDQWAVSPVVSLSADEKQNGTLIIEYTKE